MVRGKGDFVTHYSSKFDKKLRNFPGKPIELWITSEVAKESLEKTIKILKATICELFETKEDS